MSGAVPSSHREGHTLCFGCERTQKTTRLLFSKAASNNDTHQEDSVAHVWFLQPTHHHASSDVWFVILRVGKLQSFMFLFSPPETARDHFSRNHRMEVMEGIISPTSNHYELKKDLVPWQHRCEMIRLALKPLHGSKHWVQLSDWECSQNSWTRTIEVLKHHQQLYDDRFGKDNVAVKFLCGADLFESFNKDVWLDKDIETITRDFGVVVITRQGNDPWQTLTQSRRSAILTKHKVMLSSS